jgi:hypothetical protein
MMPMSESERLDGIRAHERIWQRLHDRATQVLDDFGTQQRKAISRVDRLSAKSVIAMSKFKIDFHVPRGTVVTYDCRTEQNYLRVKAFLLEQLGLPESLNDAGRTDPIFYYIETVQQKEMLFNFLRALRRQAP